MIHILTLVTYDTFENLYVFLLRGFRELYLSNWCNLTDSQNAGYKLICENVA